MSSSSTSSEDAALSMKEELRSKDSTGVISDDDENESENEDGELKVLCWPEDDNNNNNNSENRRRRKLSCCRFLELVNYKLFYSYMNRVLRKGAMLHRQRRRRRENAEKNIDNGNDTIIIEEEEISQYDLYQAPQTMSAKYLQYEFLRLRKKQSLRQQQKKSSNNKTKNPIPSLRSEFIHILWNIAKPTYIPAGIYQFLQLASQCTVPMLVREVLIELEEHPNTSFTTTGLPLAFGLFVVSIFEGICMERQKFLAFQSGIILKSSIINAIYDHVFKLTPTGKIGLTSGETINLVSIDSQKLFELTQEGHQLWSCPLAMIIVTILLLFELGPVTLIGMASMIILVPITQQIVVQMMRVRKKRIAQTDLRVEATTSMIQSIKFTKLNSYESRFLNRIQTARQIEVKYLRYELSLYALTMFLTVVSPVIASAITFITYVLINDSENTLSASTTFTTLYLFAIMRFPIAYAGKLMGKLAQGLQACQRLALFFHRECRDSNNNDDIDTEEEENDTSNTEEEHKDINDDDDVMVKVVNKTFTVGSVTADDDEASLSEISDDNASTTSHNSYSNKSSFTVSDINVTVKRGEILCIVGPVGSGKSTLCQGLIGDVPSSEWSEESTAKAASSSSLHLKGKVSYASQTPFILNATIRDNILFGNPYNKDRYDQVLDMCCLLQDLEQIGPARDLTEIGERGVTLSGGQKQRVSLARVAYSQPNVAILDDPLSALDAATGKTVFEKLFKSEKSPLSKTAIVLVTHASHFLQRVDNIMVLVNGNTVFLGNWNELATFHPTNNYAAEEAISALRSAVQEDHSEEDDDSENEDKSSIQKVTKDDTGGGGDLMTIEEREYGLSDWRTWLKWFHYAGGFFFVTVAIIFLCIDRLFYVATEWWLASWTSGETESITRFGREFPPQTDGQTAQSQYITVYGIILIISFAGTTMRSQWLVQAGARCSNRLFGLMTSKIIRAPMSYFETTPLGRILNRFTYDIETLDITLTQNMTMLMTSLGWFVTGIVLQAVILPWQLLAIVVIMAVYWLLLLHYRKSAVDLQRLDGVSRSPIQAQLAELLDGASTIRVFQKVSFFSDMFRSSLDGNSSAMMNFMAAQRWLGVRIQLIGSCAVLFSVCVVVSFNDVLRISPGIAAMLVIWSSNFTLSLGFMIQAISESEASLTSVERVSAMTDLPQEKDITPSSDDGDESSIVLREDWPSDGSLDFNNVALRYRPGLPLSLDGLTFSLKSGQRCGVVGRTGAGKSTLTVALFRLVNIESGTITLDGVDLSKISLADVRGRKNGMCIIPQDPILYSGCLRECLDPFNDSTDDQVLDALQAIRVANASERGLEALRDHVEEGGRNYSVGERQLLCLARAILAKPKVLVLDEATASVDGETDAFIQRMIRTRFEGTTLLTVAHRLNTIMDYDVILAMENGKAAEFGSPQELLERKGLFSSLVDSTGKQSSVTLRRMSQVDTLE